MSSIPNSCPSCSRMLRSVYVCYKCYKIATSSDSIKATQTPVVDSKSTSFRIAPRRVVILSISVIVCLVFVCGGLDRVGQGICDVKRMGIPKHTKKKQSADDHPATNPTHHNTCFHHQQQHCASIAPERWGFGVHGVFGYCMVCGMLVWGEWQHMVQAIHGTDPPFYRSLQYQCHHTQSGILIEVEAPQQAQHELSQYCFAQHTFNFTFNSFLSILAVLIAVNKGLCIYM